MSFGEVGFAGTLQIPDFKSEIRYPRFEIPRGCTMLTINSGEAKVRAPNRGVSISQLLGERAYEYRSLRRWGGSASEANRGLLEEVVLDCGHVMTVSSQDLNALIEFNCKLRQQSAGLVLTNVQESVARVFEMTRLNRLFTVYEAMTVRTEVTQLDLEAGPRTNRRQR
jgi:anti-anti-sigma factor